MPSFFVTILAAASMLLSIPAFAGQGAQRMLYAAPNITFIESKNGDHAITITDTSGSIATLQASIDSTRAANPTNVIIIRLQSNAVYSVSSAGLVLGSHECLVGSGATLRAASAAVTVPLITITNGAVNVSIAGGTLDGNGANINGITAPAARRVNVDMVIVKNCGQDCILLKGQGNSTYDNEMTVTRCDASSSPTHAGISIQNCTQAAVLDNNCHHNATGIYLSCAWADVANNACHNNTTGIDVAGGNDNVVANNTCNHNGTGIRAGASNNMLVSNATGTNSVAGINSNGSGNTFVDNLFTGGNAANFTSGGSGNHIVAYKTPLSASGQDYFYPPLIDDQHTNTAIVNGMGRTDLTIGSTTIASVQSQYDSARAANPNNVIVLHLNGTFTVGSSSLTLQSNTCVLLNGTIQINGSTTASAAVKDGSSSKHISISGGIIDGSNLTGNNGISMSGAAMAQIDAMTVRNFGPENPRSGGSDSIHLSGGSLPYIVTRCYVTNSSSRGIWLQLSGGRKSVMSDNEVTAVNQDGVDCDSSTYGCVVKFNYCHDLTRYGVFFEQSASHNVALGNICNNDGRDINLYNNSTTPRGDTAFNSVLCNNLMNGNALRNGSTGTNVVKTSHNFMFNNTVINASINSETFGTENYYSQNYQSSGSLSTAGTEAFFNSSDVSSNLYVLDSNSGLPLLAKDAATTNGTPIVIGPASGLDNDQWALIPTDSGFYRLTNKKSKSVAAVSGASLSPGAAIVQSTFGSAKNDQWTPMSADDGLYYFVNRLSGLCLTVSSGASGSPLTQQAYTGAAGQKFSLSLNASALVVPPFFLSATPGAASIFATGSTNYVVTLSTNTGFVPPVTFVVSGLPSNSIGAFSPVSLSSNGTTTLTVTTSNSTPAGNYTLSIVGNGSNATNTVSVTLSVASLGSNLVWNSSASPAWDTTSLNWFNALIGTNDVFQNGKNVTFADRANVVTNITLAAGVSVSPANVVATADATIYTLSGAGKITGTTGLSKGGNGLLVLNTTNDFTGIVTISNGVVSTPLLANGGTASGIGAGAATADKIVFDGGTLQWTSTSGASINRGFTLTLNGGTIDSSPPSGTGINLALSGAIAYSGSGDRTLVLAGTDPNPLSIGGNIIAGTIADGPGGVTSLEKDGDNAWNLSGANTFSGGCTVNGGRLRATTSAQAFGTGPVTVADGAQAYCSIGAVFANAFFIQGIGIPETEGNYGALRLAANACNLTNVVTLINDARITARGATGAGAFISGQITGDADLEFGNSGGGAGILTLSNSLNNWSGNTTVSHGTLKLAATDVLPHGPDTGNVIVNNSNPTNNSVLDLNGTSPTINGLSSSGADLVRCIITNSSPAAVTLTIGDNDAGGTYGGQIKNTAGAISLVKIGLGTETLTSLETYTGTTTVSNGTLIVLGTLANSAVTVKDTATLAGSGNLNGAVTVIPGGTLAPTGVLAINNTLTLQGTVAMTLNKSLATNDAIHGLTTLSYGGTLALTNLSGTLVAGDSFKLFAATTYAGVFAAILPATPGAGLAWNTNNLGIDGTLKVVSLNPPTPHLTGIGLNGTTLTINATNGSTGGQYVLLTSTNIATPLLLWTPLLTNYFDGNGNLNLTTNIVNPTSTGQFYLLQAQ